MYKVTMEDYVIHPDGRVWSKKAGRFLAQTIMKNGYAAIALPKWLGRSRLVHRLVAEEFLGGEHDKMDVNHRDGNKLNNHVSNLEWVSHRDNLRHAAKTGLLGTDKFVNNWKKNLKFGAARRAVSHGMQSVAVAMYRSGLYTQKELAEVFGVVQVTISQWHLAAGKAA